MNNQTIDKLRSMRLGAMARLHLQHVEQNRLDGMTCDEYLALLTDHQWEDRENNKTERLLKQAAFRQNANPADINYSAERNLDNIYRLGSQLSNRRGNNLLSNAFRIYTKK